MSTISVPTADAVSGDAKTHVNIKTVAARVTALEAGDAALRAEFEAYKAEMIARLAALTPAEKVKKGRPAKAKTAKAVALPDAAAGEAPAASEYRIDASDIDSSVCVARSLDDGIDKRWKPRVYRESQCGKPVAEGSDLCKVCTSRHEKYAADTSKPGHWNGRITEEPDVWVHMLGTDWAEDKNPVFLGPEAGSDADTGSVASGPAAGSGSSKEMTPAAAKKAEAAAAKEAKKAEAAAAKEAKKAAAAAAKEEKAKKTNEKTKQPRVPKKETESKVAEAAVAVVEGEMKLIDGTLYMVKKLNVYEYDELTQKAGDFVGRLVSDDVIDTGAEETAAPESDAE